MVCPKIRAKSATALFVVVFANEVGAVTIAELAAVSSAFTLPPPATVVVELPPISKRLVSASAVADAPMVLSEVLTAILLTVAVVSVMAWILTVLAVLRPDKASTSASPTVAVTLPVFNCRDPVKNDVAIDVASNVAEVVASDAAMAWAITRLASTVMLLLEIAVVAAADACNKVSPVPTPVPIEDEIAPELN